MREIGSKNSTLTLSVRLCTEGFSFFCCAPYTNTAVEVEKYVCSVEEDSVNKLRWAVQNSKLIKGKDIGAVYAVVSSPWMCIPLVCFRKEEAPRLLRLSYSSSEPAKTYYNILPHVEVAQIFTVEEKTERLLKKAFPVIRFYHSLSMVMEKLWLLERQGSRRLNVCFNENNFAVLAFKRGETLEYANAFPADGPENAAYYILSVWKDLGLDVQKDEVALLGEGALRETAGGLLRKYVRVVRDVQAGDICRKPLSGEGGVVPTDVQALLANVF